MDEIESVGVYLGKNDKSNLEDALEMIK